MRRMMRITTPSAPKTAACEPPIAVAVVAVVVVVVVVVVTVEIILHLKTILGIYIYFMISNIFTTRKFARHHVTIEKTWKGIGGLKPFWWPCSAAHTLFFCPYWRILHLRAIRSVAAIRVEEEENEEEATFTSQPALRYTRWQKRSYPVVRAY
jgi:hypothetical protein